MQKKTEKQTSDVAVTDINERNYFLQSLKAR